MRALYFEYLEQQNLEQVLFCHDADVGLKAIIAIHSTALGPALGGVRFFPYVDDEAALVDVARLAEGMTYKAAVAGLDLGGGKSVIIGDPREIRTEALIRAFGRHIASLGGRYITAEDVGTTRDDMDLIHRETQWVTGTSPFLGGSDDPSPVTAFGVEVSMRAAAEHRWGSQSLADRHVAVQGVGKVGYSLVRFLIDDGARVTVADRSPDAVERCVHDFGCETAGCAEILTLDCDVLAPCALGGIFDDALVEDLRCELICGAANNQLVTEEIGESLRKREILYTPDFVVNAGGLINVAMELEGYDRDRAMQKVEQIGATTTAILRLADAEAISTAVAARRVAEERIRAISRLQHMRSPGGHDRN